MNESAEALYHLLMMERFGGPTMAQREREQAQNMDTGLAAQVLANEAYRIEHTLLRAKLRKPPGRATYRGWRAKRVGT